ncbi:MAG: hypothetical protein IPM83_09205 [Ignavibacteria bacterium]|nr:hypothetical protein [Ignavibacteria bacterium]
MARSPSLDKGLAMAELRSSLLRASAIPLLWTALCGLLIIVSLDASPHVGLVSFDAGNFILAGRHFNIAADRPHLPGYPGIVALSACADPILGPASGLRLLGLLIPLSAILLGLGLHKRLGWKGAMWTQTLLLTSPVVWFFALAAETYAVDLAAGTIVTLIIVRDRDHRWLPALLGVTSFFRPMTAVLLLPGILWLLWSKRSSLSLTTLTVPLIVATAALGATIYGIVLGSGGIDGLKALVAMGPPVAFRPFSELVPFLAYGTWFCIPLIPMLLTRSSDAPDTCTKPLFIVFITALVFFVTVHYAKGYLLLVVPATIVGVVTAKRVTWTMMAMIVVLQCTLFLLIPSADDPLPRDAPGSSSSAFVRVWERFTSSYSCTLDRLDHEHRFWDQAMPWMNEHTGPIMFSKEVAPSVRIAQAVRSASDKSTSIWWGHARKDDQEWVRYDENGVHIERMLDTALSAATLFTRDSLSK